MSKNTIIILVIGLVLLCCCISTGIIVIFAISTDDSNTSKVIEKDKNKTQEYTEEKVNKFYGSYYGEYSLTSNNPQTPEKVTKYTVDLMINEDGSAYADVYVNEDKYNVYLDPESSNPLVLYTLESSIDLQISGRVEYENGTFMNYAPTYNGYDVEAEVVNGEYYPLTLNGDGYIEQYENDQYDSIFTTITIDGAISYDKAHIVVSGFGNESARFWIYKN